MDFRRIFQASRKSGLHPVPRLLCGVPDRVTTGMREYQAILRVSNQQPVIDALSCQIGAEVKLAWITRWRDSLHHAEKAQPISERGLTAPPHKDCCI
jgi:hypothetical protein